MGIIERKEREREARRTAILDAAETVFKLKGFTNSTMDDIAREAELAKGTVYLYYKSKEELQIGLITRGLDMLYDAFVASMQGKMTAIERLLTTGQTYWDFAEEHLFYFSLMHVMDLPQRNAQAISQEALVSVNEKSQAIWTLLVGEFEKAKKEGTIKPEVNSVVVTMMLWMNATGVLRFHHKVRSSPNAVWAESEEFNVCKVDWRSIYALNANLLLHEVVTTRGLMYLESVEWPSAMSMLMMPCAPPTERSFGPAFQLAPFVDEEMSYLYGESGV